MELVSRSLRLKVSLGVSLTLVLLLVPVNWLQHQFQLRAATDNLRQLASTTAAIAAHSLEGAMLTANRGAVQAIVDSVAQSTDVNAVYLLTPRARVAASPGGVDNGKQLDRTSAECRNCHQFPPTTRPRSIVIATADGQTLFRTMTPIPNRPECSACHSPDDRLNGVFYMDFSMVGLKARLDRGLRTALIASAAIAVLPALAIYLLLSWLVITPMERVAQALSRFSRGERKARATVHGHDEVGLLAGVFNEMAETIQAQEQGAERLYAELAAKDSIRRQLLDRLTVAREVERRHVAREIHDDLGQLLTGLSLNLKLCQQAIPEDPQKATAYLAKANALIGDTIEKAHRLIADLRPTVLDDYGLIPALEQELGNRLTPLGIAAELDSSGMIGQLPPEVATAAFRIAQEAITNVIRHARASRVHFTVHQTTDRLEMTIEDDGVGIPEGDFMGTRGARQALGILGMQERADALAGRLEVLRRQPRGTRLVLTLPFYRRAE